MSGAGQGEPCKREAIRFALSRARRPVEATATLEPRVPGPDQAARER